MQSIEAMEYTATEQLPIPVDSSLDNDLDDTSADYHSGSEYSTQSLTSSIYEYRFENGRRYHSYGEDTYAFPNDEAEQDRLDILHHIYLLLHNDKLHLAPICENPQRILDIGTGTGIWAIDAGERYPSAEVIGTDLSPIQPSWVPPNVHFQIDDAENDWTWEKNSFDLIHMRMLGGAIKDWPALLKQAYLHTKPGGYIYLHEFDLAFYSDDGTYTEETCLWKWCMLVNKACAKSGREFKNSAHMAPILEAVGFENVQREMKKLPLGAWPADKKNKEMGAFFLLTTDNVFEALGMALLTRELDMDVEEVKVLIDGAKREAKSRKIHCYAKQHLYYGQKPDSPL